MLLVFEGISGVGTHIVCRKLGECLENSRVLGVSAETFSEILSLSKKFTAEVEVNVDINYRIAGKMISYLNLLDAIIKKNPDKIYIINKYYYNLVAYQIMGFLKFNKNFKNRLFRIMCKHIYTLVAKLQIPDYVFHLKSDIYGGKDAIYGLSIRHQNVFLTKALTTVENRMIINHNSDIDRTVFTIKSAILRRKLF